MIPQAQDLFAQLKNNPMFSPKYCENCGLQHVEEDFAFLGHQDGSLLFQISCRSCGLTYILRLHPSISGLAAQKLEANVDITSPAELKKFAGKSKVEKDEALQVYIDIRKVQTIKQFLDLFDQ
jgi:hypothetical protein